MKKQAEPVVLYVRQMEEVKQRMEVISQSLRTVETTPYKQASVESIGLQFRKVLELIAFASLCANRNAYSKVHEDYAKHHRADILLKELERVNPLFYPAGVRNTGKKVDGVEMPELVPGALTKEEFVDIFKKCGRLLHTPNPFSGIPSLEFYLKSFPVWLNKVVLLLNIHMIHLVDEPTMWIINMQEDGDDRVHAYTFERVSNR